MAEKTFNSDEESELLSQPVTGLIPGQSVGNERASSIIIINVNPDYSFYSQEEDQFYNHHQTHRPLHYDGDPDIHANQSVGSSNYVFLTTPTTVEGFGPDGEEVEERSITIEAAENYLARKREAEIWDKFEKMAVTYKRWEELVWWEHLNRIHMLRSKESEGDINQGLRTLRSAYFIPRESLFFGRKLGRGAFGEVHLVHTTRGKRYAVKILNPEFNEENFFKLRLERDAMLLLNHKNIISIKATWHILRTPQHSSMYIVMEYAKYGHMRNYIRNTRGGLMSEVHNVLRRSSPSRPSIEVKQQLIQGTLMRIQEEIDDLENRNPYDAHAYRAITLRFSQEFVEAMDYMCKKGVYHEDLSLDNVLIGEGFHIKLADFGCTSINHPLYQGPRHPYVGPSLHQRFPGPVTVGNREHEYYFTFHFLVAVSTGMNITGMEDLFLFPKQLRIQWKRAILPQISSALFVDAVQKDVAQALEYFSNFTFQHFPDNPFHMLLQMAPLFDQRRHQETRSVDIDRFVERRYKDVDVEDSSLQEHSFQSELESGLPVEDLWMGYRDQSLYQSP